MAPPLQVTNAGLLRIIWSNAGTPYAVNVYGVMGTAATPPTQALVNTLATGITGAYAGTGLAAVQGTGITLTGVNLRSINVANTPELVGTVTPVGGTDAGSLLPLQVSYCVTIRTNVASRRTRGRSYITGFTNAANAPTGTPTAATRTAAVAFVNMIDTQLIARGWSMGVVSRPVWTETPPGSGTFVQTRAGSVEDVTSTLGRDLIWDTQRRRLYPGI